MRGVAGQPLASELWFDQLLVLSTQGFAVLDFGRQVGNLAR